MELELKHIAPYFRYELKCQYAGILSGVLHIGVLQEISLTHASFEHKMWWSYGSIKPILKPISEFDPRNMETDDNIKKFVGSRYWCDAYDKFLGICSNDMANLDTRLLQAPYPIFNYLLSQHYDIFGLIPKGLAISLNEIK